MTKNINEIKIFLSSSKTPYLFRTFQKAAIYVMDRSNTSDWEINKRLFEQEFGVRVKESIDMTGDHSYEIAFHTELDYTLFLMKWL